MSACRQFSICTGLNRVFVAALFFVVGIFALNLSAKASEAQSIVDVVGSWTYNVDVNGVPNNTQTWALTQDGSLVLGTGQGNGFTWHVSGTATASSLDVTVSYNEISYTMTAHFVVSGDTMTGTWSDSFSQHGGISGTRSIVSASIDTATSLACVRGPAAKDNFVCTATVVGEEPGDAAPSGVVQFFLQTGSYGSGSSCNLSAVSSTSSSCGITVIQPVGGLPAGQPVPLSANYGGDDSYNESSAESAVTTITVLPTAPSVCLSGATTACQGVSVDALEPEVVGNSLGTISFGYFAPIAGQAEGPFAPAARVSAPKNPGEANVEFRYVVRAKDNPSLAGNRAIKNLASQIRNGLIITSVQSKLAFGQRKDIVAGLNSKGQKLMKALRGASISQIKLSIAVGVRRKGDRRGTSIASTTTATIR